MPTTPTWKTRSEDDAQQHPLYGVGGWLLVFAAGLLLGLLRLLGDFSSLAHEANITIGEMLDLDLPIASFLKGALVIQIAAVVLIYVMMAVKAPSFRTATTCCLLASFPLTAAWGALHPFNGVGAIIGQGLVTWVISSAVWITYLHRSRRVRITFEHAVRTDDAPADVTTEMHSRSQRSDGTRPTLQTPESMANVIPSPVAAQAAQADEEHWSQALVEFEGPERRPGLWARCFVQADGDETKAKVAYLRDRAHELAAQFQAFQDERAIHESQNASPPADSTSINPSSSSPMGSCPNCKTALPVDAHECPSCKALFDEHAAWKPIPLIRRPLVF